MSISMLFQNPLPVMRKDSSLGGLLSQCQRTSYLKYLRISKEGYESYPTPRLYAEVLYNFYPQFEFSWNQSLMVTMRCATIDSISMSQSSRELPCRSYSVPKSVKSVVCVCLNSTLLPSDAQCRESWPELLTHPRFILSFIYSVYSRLLHHASC